MKNKLQSSAGENTLHETNKESSQSGPKPHCNRPICWCGLTLHTAAVEISS